MQAWSALTGSRRYEVCPEDRRLAGAPLSNIGVVHLEPASKKRNHQQSQARSRNRGRMTLPLSSNGILGSLISLFRRNVTAYPLALEVPMAVAKITEISSESPKSFEDAINTGIARAEKTLRNLTGAWIKSQKVVITKGKITEYRVLLKVTFVLTD